MESKELKYYNINIYCHEYFRDGVIEENVELYSTLEDLPDDVDDYVIETYGKEFFDNATEYGPLKFEINSTEEDLEEDCDYESLTEELNKSNIQKLHDKLTKRANIFYNMEMHSSYIDGKSATDEEKETYRKACEEFSNISTKIEGQGAYLDTDRGMKEAEISPTYFVYDISESHAVDLAKRLFQDAILKLEFKEDGTFDVYRIDVPAWKNTGDYAEVGHKILTNIDKRYFNGWTVLDGMTFTFDIYGNADRDEFKQLTEESSENEEEVVEETKEYKIVKTNSISYKTKNGVVVGKPIKRPIFQVYFRVQDFNPSVNRWMNRGWSLRLTDFKTLEDARAFVKKYGKTLKSELTESKEEKEYYYNYDVLCDIYYKGGVIHRDEEAYAKSYDDLCKLVVDEWEYEDNLEDVGEVEVKLNYTDDPAFKGTGLYSKESDDDLEEDIEKHDTLNPLLFEDNELKPDVKEAIEKIAKAFTDGLAEDGVKFTLKDIVLLGSNCSYNYTKDSDLDIHLIADSSDLHCPDELYPLLYSAYRSMFNKNYDITIKGIPAEIYVEMDKPQAKSNGIYSLNTGWIKEPVQQDIPDLDEEEFDKSFSEWEDKYFELLSEIDEGSDKLEVTDKTA